MPPNLSILNLNEDLVRAAGALLLVIVGLDDVVEAAGADDVVGRGDQLLLLDQRDDDGDVAGDELVELVGLGPADRCELDVVGLEQRGREGREWIGQAWVGEGRR